LQTAFPLDKGIACNGAGVGARFRASGSLLRDLIAGKTNALTALSKEDRAFPKSRE
jgi:hypothetical protein